MITSPPNKINCFILCPEKNEDFCALKPVRVNELDELNLIFAVDKKMADFWEVFAPEYNIFLLENPMEASGNLALTKPIVMSGGAWMDDEDD